MALTLINTAPPYELLGVFTLLQQASERYREVSMFVDEKDNRSISVIDGMGVKHFYTFIDGAWHAGVQVYQP